MSAIKFKLAAVALTVATIPGAADTLVYRGVPGEGEIIRYTPWGGGPVKDHRQDGIDKIKAKCARGEAAAWVCRAYKAEMPPAAPKPRYKGGPVVTDPSAYDRRLQRPKKRGCYPKADHEVFPRCRER